MRSKPFKTHLYLSTLSWASKYGIPSQKKKLWFYEKMARWWPLKWVKILSNWKREGGVVGFRMSFSGRKSTLVNTPYIDAVGYTSPSQLAAGYPGPWKRWLLQHMAIFGICVRFSGVYLFPTLHKPLPVSEFSNCGCELSNCQYFPLVN